MSYVFNFPADALEFNLLFGSKEHFVTIPAQYFTVFQQEYFLLADSLSYPHVVLDQFGDLGAGLDFTFDLTLDFQRDFVIRFPINALLFEITTSLDGFSEFTHDMERHIDLDFFIEVMAGVELIPINEITIAEDSLTYYMELSADVFCNSLTHKANVYDTDVITLTPILDIINMRSRR